MDENKSIKTNVSFESAGLKLAGHLYTPDPDTSPSLPAIVVGPPGSSVKEQAAGMYARRLAERGFITLAFDPAYQGESEGEPRGLEDPSHRVEDIKAAVSFLSVRDQVAPNRVGALGICASGGYVIPATATDYRIKAVAAVSAVDMGRQFRVLCAGGAVILPTLENMLAACARLILTGREDRSPHRRGPRRRCWNVPGNGVDRIASFNAFRFIAMIAPRPLFMIVGTDGVHRMDDHGRVRERPGTQGAVLIKGATHVALYDRDEYVTPAVSKLVESFRNWLTA
jgi:hypothetical protein